MFAKANASTIHELEAYTKRTTGSYLSDEQRMAMSDFKERFFTCSFHNTPCDITSFQYVYFPSYYNCYRFNAGYYYNGSRAPLQTVVTSGGLISSLNLELYAGLPNSISGTSNTRGFYVFIHNTVSEISLDFSRPSEPQLCSFFV